MISFHRYDTTIIKKFDKMPEGFILPRIGDHVSFDDKQDWVVIDVSHCFESNQIIIGCDDFNNYDELLTRKDGA